MIVDVAMVLDPHNGWCRGPVYVHPMHEGRRWIVETDADLHAALDIEGHSFWKLNPGLRQRVLQQMAAERLA